jgi:hypothetical protein
LRKILELQQVAGKIFYPKELRAIPLSKSQLLITALAGSGSEVKREME